MVNQPVIPQISSSHWSKDFVEHLRVVHFTLVAVACALIITGINSEGARLSKALTQIQQVSKFERDWPGVARKLYEQSILDSGGQTAWYGGIEIELPAEVYRAKSIRTYINVPTDLILESEEWKFGGQPFPHELSKLSDFRDFWNSLHKGRQLVIPERPSPNTACEEQMVLKHPDGSEEFFVGVSPVPGAGISQCKVNESLETSGPNLEVKQMLGFASSSEVILKISTTLPPIKVPNSRSEKKYESESLIHLKTKATTIHEDQLKRLYFNDWGTGQFEDAFPELNSASAGMRDIDINDAARRIESQAAASEKSISLLGFNIPIPELSQWGLLVLLAVQMYLWLHLHELTGRIQPGAEGWNVAWVGLYNSRAATFASLVTCFVLPLFASLILAVKITIGTTHHPWITRSAVSCGVLISGIFGILTVARLAKLREQRS